MTEKRIVEINGIKMEIDLSTAKRIDEFKIGDNIKVLRKDGSTSYKVLAGVIVEFVNFKELPTIVIATFETDYWSDHLSFIYFNSQSENIEITPCCEHELKLEKNKVVDLMQQKINKAQKEAEGMQAKLDYFEKCFSKYFSSEGV